MFPVYDTIWSLFRHYRTKIRKMEDRNRRVKNCICSTFVLHILYFLVNNYSLHYSKHHLLHHSKYHLLSFTQLSLSYQLFYHILNTIISIFKYCYIYATYCNYIVTIIITTLYSYIYRYNLSIKIYDNQYRYKHTD